MHRGDLTGGRPRRSRRFLPIAGLAAFVLVLSACSSTLPQSSLNPLSEEAEQINQLWTLVLWIATVIFVLVEAGLIVSIIKWRRRPGDETEPEQVHGNTTLEIAWTIVPAVILAIVAVPTLKTLFDLRAPVDDPDVLRVEVVGHQWWWEFRYPDLIDDSGNPLVTANELHLPAGRTAELTMTSADVIHSFWVPPLSGKRDLLPGRETFLKITPTEDAIGEPIQGQCAEFCWIGHADMRILAFVESEPDFETWAAGQLEPVTEPTEGPAAAGFEIFTQLCAACHQANVDGTVIGNAIGPNLTHFGSRETLGAAILDNSAEHLAQWIDDPSALKAMAPELNDLEAGRILGMPDYGLDPDEIAGLVALLKGWE